MARDGDCGGGNEVPVIEPRRDFSHALFGLVWSRRANMSPTDMHAVIDTRASARPVKLNKQLSLPKKDSRLLT